MLEYILVTFITIKDKSKHCCGTKTPEKSKMFQIYLMLKITNLIPSR